MDLDEAIIKLEKITRENIITDEIRKTATFLLREKERTNELKFLEEANNIVNNLTSGDYVILEKPFTEIYKYRAIDKYGHIFELKQVRIEELEKKYFGCSSCGRRMYYDKKECDMCRLNYN